MNDRRPVAPKRTTSYFRGIPPSIPGDPPGMPGTASPTAAGRFSNNCRKAKAGTWPSIMYPAISAVWQAARSPGTPRRFRTAGSCAVSSTVTVNPASLRCCTQPVQHPQFGSLWTRMAGVCAEAGYSRATNPAAKIASALRRVTVLNLYIFWTSRRRLVTIISRSSRSRAQIRVISVPSRVKSLAKM